MNSKHDNDLLTLGMDVGLYIISGFMAEGFVNTQRGWEILRENRSEAIAKMTGQPAEDVALMLQPAIETMLEQVKQAGGGE